VSFDGAAETYDATRGLPPEIVAKQADAIEAELRAAGVEHLLEVGIGTGRITRPLMERGARVAGLDIAPNMMAKLRAQLGPGHVPPDLMLGDGTRLPLRDASFGAVLMVHVLHLVSDWRNAIAEMRRVLAPGGVFLHDRTRYDADNPWRRSMDKREELLASYGVTVRRRPKMEEIEAALRDGGGTLRQAVYAENVERELARDMIERVRMRVDSWTWEIPEAVHAEFLSRYEAWCRDQYGDLQEEIVQNVQYTLEVWTFS
jgi:ubiquinone/menaquinone biosynthesis C-methylase UbiE